MSYAFWAAGFIFLAVLNVTFAIRPPDGDVPWWLYAVMAVVLIGAAIHACFRAWCQFSENSLQEKP